MEEMLRTGVPAAITLAQGIHESGAGKGDLCQRSNNHFGIKCKSNWTGATVKHDDDASQECFRAYNAPVESYRDHSDFLKANARYAFLFDYDPTDYQAWAKGLKQAGYATNPKYAPILIKTIEQYRLNDYTLLALNRTNVPVDMAITSTNVTDATGDVAYVRKVSNPAFNVSNTYPTGVFSINNCKVIFAEKGSSLLACAMRNNVSLSNLMSWNEMEEQQILETNQLIFLEKKQKKGDKVFHEVQPGETLWQISQLEGVRFSNLLQYNKISGDEQPAPGEKIYLQGYAEQTPKLVK